VPAWIYKLRRHGVEVMPVGGWDRQAPQAWICQPARAGGVRVEAASLEDAYIEAASLASGAGFSMSGTVVSMPGAGFPCPAPGFSMPGACF